ncbi:tail fiber domain-containing protein [Caballeronia sp. LZ025]|uniref:tail fiber domain-containing protein n=1 Tax=Caballeronia TaxID=1827195 RepID=UPI001FD4BFE3|nr:MULTISPECIES: tail fiber domain-containing protein [Caballeronia]MDR5736127.1 tail fiber domain-containing protein [Caballeronia sp. LZ025]
MATLQKVNLGTPPTAVDGDTVRVANTKVNANVDVLNTQIALASAAATITSAQALTNAHVGKRVNINLASAGTINVPAASTCAADQVIHLRNVGTTVVTLAITAGSGDSVAVSRLNPGESVLMDTDGVHYWGALMRGRSNSDNEVVNGTLSVTGAITATGGFSTRPKFAGATPWDSANLVQPVKSSNNAVTVQWTAQGLFYAIDATGIGYFVDNATAMSIGGQKTFTATPICSVAASGTYTGANLWLQGLGAGYAHLGFSGNGNSAAAQLRSNSAGGLDAVNWNASSYTSFTASSFPVGSDAALKRDVVSLTGVMPRLRTKRGARYLLKSDNSPQIGVIAQEWVDDFPELVETNGPEIDEDGDFIAHQYDDDGNEIYGPNGKPASRPALTFKYDNLAAVLLQGLLETDAALQSALARISALEAKAPA